MKVKEYLSQLFWIDRDIQTLMDERAEILSSTFKSPIWSDMKVQSSAGKQLEDLYVELAEYSERIIEKSDELIRLKIQISKQIDEIEETQLRVLLRLRYTMGLSWEQVAQNMNLDVRWVHRIHNKALIQFDKKFAIESHKEKMI